MSSQDYVDPVRSAKFRAQVTATLNRMDQRTVLTKDLMKALEPVMKELNVTKSSAYYHIRAMGEGGLIYMQETATGRKLFGPKRGGVGKKEVAEIQPIEPTPVPNKHMHHVPTSPQVVELEVAGVTLIVGRNPVTGRPRIVIEG